MNENDIYKGLECCQGAYNRKCKECPYDKYKIHCISTVSCSSLLRKDLLELLNSYRERMDGDKE